MLGYVAYQKVCCCIKHVNIEYLRLKINAILKVNESNILFENNKTLVH